MDPVKNQNIALLSIKPKYVELICSGRKRVEFRKTRFARKVNKIAIYATSPIKKIVALFKVGKILEGSPSEIWGKYHSIGGIELNEYQSYYCKSRKAIAIEILDLNILSQQVPLNSLSKYLSPPQSYYYLPKSEYLKLTKCGCHHAI